MNAKHEITKERMSCSPSRRMCQCRPHSIANTQIAPPSGNSVNSSRRSRFSHLSTARIDANAINGGTPPPRVPHALPQHIERRQRRNRISDPEHAVVRVWGGEMASEVSTTRTVHHVHSARSDHGDRQPYSENKFRCRTVTSTPRDCASSCSPWQRSAFGENLHVLQRSIKRPADAQRAAKSN